jgi:hypothetical protein
MPTAFRPLQRGEARRQRLHLEVMPQAVKPPMQVACGKPRYPLQFRVRHSAGLWWTHDVSPPRSILPRDLPSTGVTPLLQ